MKKNVIKDIHAELDLISFYSFVLEIIDDFKEQGEVEKPEFMEINSRNLTKLPLVILIMLKHIFESPLYEELKEDENKKIILNQENIDEIWQIIREQTNCSCDNLCALKFLKFPGIEINFLYNKKILISASFSKNEILKQIEF